jgi:hypothetical protein
VRTFSLSTVRRHWDHGFISTSVIIYLQNKNRRLFAQDITILLIS